MLKYILFGMVSLMFLAACENQTDSDPTVVPLTILEVTEEVNSTITPTLGLTPSPTAIVPTATSGSVNNAAAQNTTNCTPRTDWVMTHTVQQGETLAGLADWAATSVDILAQGNCISNPNQLQVGQVIRVPIVPSPTPVGYVPPAPLPTGGTPPRIVAFTSNVTEAEMGEPITISWQVEGADQGIYLRREYRDTAVSTAQAPQDWENLGANGSQSITFSSFPQERYILTAVGQNQQVRQELVINWKDKPTADKAEVTVFSGTVENGQITLLWEVQGTVAHSVTIRTVLPDNTFGLSVHNQPLSGNVSLPIPEGVSETVSFLLVPIDINGQEVQLIQNGKHQLTVDLP